VWHRDARETSNRRRRRVEMEIKYNLSLLACISLRRVDDLESGLISLIRVLTENDFCAYLEEFCEHSVAPSPSPSMWISVKFYILVEKIWIVDVCIHLVPVL